MTILITFYGEILQGAAEHVLAQLRADPSAAVEVRINSPGGSVSDGLAIFNALKPRKCEMHIDGIAASIASLIAMAGTRIYAAENALMMIHDPWCGTEGNATALRRTADLLDKHRDAMVGGYARTGLPRPDLIALLAAETWMTADEALHLGFVDEISESLRYAAHAPDCFAGYTNTPEELLMRSTAHRAAVTTDPNLPQDPAKPKIDLKTADDQSTLEAFKKGLASDGVTKAAHDAVMEALRARNESITAMAEPYLNESQPIRALTMNALSDPTITAADFGQAVLAQLARGRGPLNGGGMVYSHASGPRDLVQAASDALAVRAGVRVDKPHPGMRDVQSMSLQEIMRACVNSGGRSFDFDIHSNGGLVRAAMSTSDFPAILENTLGKALRGGFEVEPSTHEAWTTKVTVPDFKLQSRVILGSGPNLLPVPEGGEYTYGSMAEDKSVPYSVEKFGRLVKFTWETLINDDLGAFLRMTQALGQAAARAEADAVYSTFALTAGAGPAMQDTATLFHATHGNLAASAAGLTADALGAARVLLRRQTAVGGGMLNLTPRFLLVAPEHEQAAETLLAAAARSMSQGTDAALVPAWLAKLELVVEARLPTNAFYLLAGPGAVDTYERAWLEADNGPVIQEQDSFNSDAKSYKVRHVFGGRWLDWRGAVKVPLA